MPQKVLLFLLVLMVSVFTGFAENFQPLHVLPEDQRERSAKEAYLYFFMVTDTASGAKSASFYSIECNLSDPSVYKGEKLIGLVDEAKGYCQAGSVKSDIDFLFVGGANARLRLRIPLVLPLDSSSVMKLKLSFYENASTQGRFFIGTTPDFQTAVEIFVREAAVETRAKAVYQLVLKGEDMEAFLKGNLAPQKGALPK